MKICPNCQFECTDQDRFCAKCGMPFPENAAEEQPQAQEVPTFVKPDAEPKAEEPKTENPYAAPQAPTYQAPPRYIPPQSNGEEPVSTGKWILYHLIPLIPGVGGIVYIVMLFIWAFGSNTENTTFRNWARSQLILSAISIVLVIFVVILLVVLGVTGAMAFGDAMDSEFYYEYGY